MRSNIYLLENIFKEESVNYKVKEELDNYVEEISRLFTLKQNLKIHKIFNTATGILKIALGIVGEEIELIEISKKEIEDFKEKRELIYKEKENKITNYYLGVINEMNKNLEECCFKILEEQSKVESVYFTFRNEIKRLKRKMKKMKKKRVKRVKKTSSDSDIWDVFK
ncbi:hypothetical protein NBO_16g0064 [Nosema bombycis CQ1]|uniref:Uncharacterized protein n=1 Tax=Nosema bombycis (strain CQ1 / CVCC 102059) TaxID=578461 RepID=R0M9Y4_NOSB1|nr:hypothetical protein NBO_16g0064 [Nosema bombycis CQ1]|eukprot:EOB14779.1 hypothetical protein NBO_16g0064 [Nosema bombycis CQ1]